MRRGDIYYADLRPVVGSEQGGAFFNCSFIVTPPEDLLPHPHLLL